jgi:Low psii accumulation1 / Rep27
MAGFEPATARLRIECSTTEPHRRLTQNFYKYSTIYKNMVEPNSQKPLNKRASQLDPEIYARLKAEAAAPYRGFRRFFYIAGAASGFIGAFVFLAQILAGRDVETALPNLALQVGVIALMVFLWQWELHREHEKGEKGKGKR